MLPKNGRDEVREDWVPGTLALIITIMVALSTLTPYVVKLPESNLNLIVQAQTTLWNGWLLVLGFYFGTNVAHNKQAQALASQAQSQARTIDSQAKAMGNLVPGSDKTIDLPPGSSVTVEATDEPGIR